MRLAFWWTIAVGLMVMLAGCGGGGSDTAALSITPGAVFMTSGETRAFTAQVLGLSNTAVTWRLLAAPGSPPGGSITADGLFTAPEGPGTYYIIATSVADPRCRAQAAIDVKPKVVGPMAVRPESIFLAMGQSYTFNALIDGVVTADVSWSIAEQAGGAITPDGIYTAPMAAGYYHVIASSTDDPAHYAMALVTVRPELAITPEVTALAIGGTTPFTATLTGTDNTAVTWSIQEGAAGGTITSAGSYLAPQQAGVYHIVATSKADPAVTATATVTVRPTLTVTPTTAVVSIDETFQFTPTLLGSANTALTWVVQEGASGGSVDANGRYAAPSQPGTYHLVATSQADPTVSVTVTVEVKEGSAVGVIQ